MSVGETEWAVGRPTARRVGIRLKVCLGNDVEQWLEGLSEVECLWVFRN